MIREVQFVGWKTCLIWVLSAILFSICGVLASLLIVFEYKVKITKSLVKGSRLSSRESSKIAPTYTCSRLDTDFRLGYWWISLGAFSILTRVWFLQAVGLYRELHFFLEWIAKWLSKLPYRMLKSLHYDREVLTMLIKTKVLYKNAPANKWIFVV